MEFKGTKGKWVVDHEERGFNEHSQLCTPISRKDKSYSTIIGLCDVYGEDEESKANALLISKSPEMLDELNETVTDLKILKGNILDALKTNHLFEGMPELIQKWIDRKELLIKQATEL